MNAHWIEASDSVKVMRCEECEIETVHHRVGKSDVFACWCGEVVDDGRKRYNPARTIKKQGSAILDPCNNER